MANKLKLATMCCESIRLVQQPVVIKGMVLGTLPGYSAEEENEAKDHPGGRVAWRQELVTLRRRLVKTLGAGSSVIFAGAQHSRPPQPPTRFQNVLRTANPGPLG